MRLANVTGKKVEEYLERSQTVLIPVGSIKTMAVIWPWVRIL